MYRLLLLQLAYNINNVIVWKWNTLHYTQNECNSINVAYSM